MAKHGLYKRGSNDQSNGRRRSSSSRTFASQREAATSNLALTSSLVTQDAASNSSASGSSKHSFAIGGHLYPGSVRGHSNISSASYNSMRETGAGGSGTGKEGRERKRTSACPGGASSVMSASRGRSEGMVKVKAKGEVADGRPGGSCAWW